MTVIYIKDTGYDRYTIEADNYVLGRQYNDLDDQIEIVRPEGEENSGCTMKIVNGYGQVIDNISMDKNVYTIRGNVSRYRCVCISFSFVRPDGSVKNSESCAFSFMEAKDPSTPIEIDPAQKENLSALLTMSITNVTLDNHTLTFERMFGQNFGIQLDVEPILKLGKGLKEDSQGALAIDESYLFQTLKIATKDDVEDRVNTKIQTVQTALDLKADLTAIANFITKSVNDLTYYYNKTEIDGKITTINNNISKIPKFAIAVVENLPTSNISPTTIYIKKTSTTESGNLYTEYIYVNDAWEELGTQTLDLSGYTTTEALNTALAEYTKTANLATIATSGKLADAKDDATHRLVTDTEKTTWNNKLSKDNIDISPTSMAPEDHVVSSAGMWNVLYLEGTGIVPNIKDGTTVAGQAHKLKTARKISLTGDAIGETTFDGTANKEIAVMLVPSGVTAGTYSAVSVNAKGLVTAGAQLIEVGDKTGTNTPTANLAIGGLFFKEI